MKKCKGCAHRDEIIKRHNIEISSLREIIRLAEEQLAIIKNKLPGNDFSGRITTEIESLYFIFGVSNNCYNKNKKQLGTENQFCEVKG